jgi:predicted Zn-dependent protease
MHANLSHLRSDFEAGLLSRHGLLEELERHLDRAADEPLEGALELILEELHRTPGDRHLLRLLARLYARNGDARSELLALGHAGAGEARSSVEDRLALARVLVTTGRLADAEALVHQVLEAEPNSLTAINLLAKIHHVSGRLSETLKQWHRLHQLSPAKEVALAQLGFLHRQAQDDASLEFAAVGQDFYARKHPAQLELEQAFARFRERDFAAAVAACDAVAAGYRSEPAVYKLAVLQKAWFQERTGELQAARVTLARLGRERGFETDIDRLAYLARVCERIGTPDALRQALHIYEHLNVHHGKLSALPRLAALSRATGAPDLAEAYQREFERRFLKRMHRPTAADVVRALSGCYVPLADVARFRPRPEDAEALAPERATVPDVAGRRRRRALLAFLSGDVSRGARALSRLCRSRKARDVDFAYLGDCLAALGQPADAQRSYLEAAKRAHPPSVPVWRQILAGARRGFLEGEVREWLVSSGRGGELREALLSAARRERASPGPWRDLAAVERWLGDRASAESHERKGEALERALADRPDVGRVLMAAVYSLYGKPKGLVHEVLAWRRRVGPREGGHLAEGGVVGNATADFEALARSALATSLDFARAHWPHLCRDADDYVYWLKVAKDDEPSSGASAGLPVAVAFLSVLTGKPVPQDVALTGALICDSRREVVVRRVGDAPYKLKGALHRDLAGIILPDENREDVASGEVVPAPAAREIARYARTLEHAVELLWGGQAWDW